MPDDLPASFVPPDATGDFPLANLPYGVFSSEGAPARRVGVAIGDHVLDLAQIEADGAFEDLWREPVFATASLNAFLRRGPAAWTAVRARLIELLRQGGALAQDPILAQSALVARTRVELHLPAEIGGYTDFFSSLEHSQNAARIMMGPDAQLWPNWRWLPVAYNGRASSVVASGTPVRRPLGQMRSGDAAVFGPCRKLDYELETGFIVGVGNELGAPVAADEAEACIFGMVLLNDWSARDIQLWESAPLGPFNGKTFATTISPWVVTMAALAPFRVAAPAQTPDPLPYLRESARRNVDLALTARLRTAEGESIVTTETNHRYLYWTQAQQIAHHTIGGCNLAPGDLIGSGTISGPEQHQVGCLFERTRDGAEPLALPSGRQRVYLEDGDELVISGCCARDGVRIGFGEARGVILPAHPTAA